jgi:hypothetical protein
MDKVSVVNVDKVHLDKVAPKTNPVDNPPLHDAVTNAVNPNRNVSVTNHVHHVNFLKSS